MVKQSRHGAEMVATPVLLTRPRAQSVRLEAALRERFGAAVRPVLTPLMQAVALPFTLPPGAHEAVVFTSEAAVDAVQGSGLGQRVPRAICVGARTAEVATAAGFSARSADGDAEALLALIRAERVSSVLYLHGRDTRGDLAQRLRDGGVRADAVLVYRQDPLALTAEARAVLGASTPVIVPLFSPRSARLFAAALPAGCAAPLALVVMSDAVRAEAEAIRHRQLEVAARPDMAAMLEATERLLIAVRGS